MKTILKNKLFLVILFTDLFSNFGDILYYLALMSYILKLNNPESALSLITLSETLPIFTGIVFGFFSDKTNRKVLLIIGTLCLRFLIYFSIAQIITEEPTQWIIWGLAIANLFSDLAGQFENSLFVPIKMGVIPNEEREIYMGFSSSITLSSSIVFNSLGALLVGFFTMKALAYLNAMTFVFCGLIMLLIKSRLTSAVKISKNDNEVNSSLLNELIENIKFVVKEMVEIEVVRFCMIIVPVLNALLSGLSIIVVLIIGSDGFIFINAPVTIAVVNISLVFGQILGGLLVTFSIANKDPLKLLKLSVYLMNFAVLALLFKQLFILLLVLFLSGILMGIINPKLLSIIMNNLPENKMSIMASSISTYFTAGIFIFKLIMSILILYLMPAQILIVLEVLCLLLTAYVLRDCIRN